MMFTIIIPTHNRPLLLRRALQSLIAQTHQNFQVIVVDDSGSYIPPFEELAALQGRYQYLIRSGIKGPAESRNKGLALLETPYILFLDDDDTFEPSHLETLAKQIEKSNAAMIFCDFKVQNEDRTQAPPKIISKSPVSIADVTQSSVFVRNRIPNSCLLYRRDVLDGIRFDTDMIIYEDWDFLLACLKKHTLVHLPVSSVVIHKSLADAPENMRRGNTRDDKIAETMLNLYKRHPALDHETRLARQALMSSAGIQVDLADC
jgi:glycosyltransferase involved in cell wall biosynthesis